jgi:uncharacterized membrane protein YhhN
VWKQVWDDPRIWRRIVALIVVLGLGTLLLGWPNGGVSLCVGVASFAASLVVLALYFLRRLPIPYR